MSDFSLLVTSEDRREKDERKEFMEQNNHVSSELKHEMMKTLWKKYSAGVELPRSTGATSISSKYSRAVSFFSLLLLNVASLRRKASF